MRLALAAVVGMAFVPGGAGGEEPALKTEEEKLSYAMGVSMARSFQRRGAAVDPELMARGLGDGLSGRKLLLGDEELRAVVNRYQGELRKRQARRQPSSAEARAQGDAFRAANARKEGVVTLPSGLQYKVLRQGDGPRPTEADKVLCHYRGSFVDGTEFDSSHVRGRPATFDMRRVIPGWREALKLMPVGSRWQIVVPPRLGYGERGQRGRKRMPGKIGPNATLIYETELLAIQPGPGGAKTAASQAPVPER